MMKKDNFKILSQKWPELNKLGDFAEEYVYSDPASSLIKLRSFAERMVQWIYRIHSLESPYEINLFELLNVEEFKDRIPKVILNKLHLLRINGNKAAHGQRVDSSMSLLAHREAYDLGLWLFIVYEKGDPNTCPSYKPPSKTDIKQTLKNDKQVALVKLTEKENELQNVLSELDQTRSKSAEVEKTNAELLAFIDAGVQAANVLKFDEATTRKRIIDTLLIEAGWDVGENGSNTEEVSQEEKVSHQPTKSGDGYADYVLWDDNGKPLAVIEAKKTAVDPKKGRTQARLYADALEKEKGQRPVIFYTNGYDIYILDDAQGYPPRRIFGFYSKDSLQYIVQQRNNKQALNTIKPRKEIVDRMYQTIALKDVSERFEQKRRKALMVMATGTGKTRVAVAFTDMLYRAGWAKRVLFLCDRLELRKQAKNVFTNFMSEPLTIVTAATAQDRNRRIYLSTYPAMSKIFQTFDVGFFDLIIADESHRSIYNRYRDIFKYFDCLQIGLTATPVNRIHKNTFTLFECEERQPTVNYALGTAVDEKYLVPFEVVTHTTKFLRDGIKYSQLTKEQQQQLEDDGEDPEQFNYRVNELDKQIFNKDTNRLIIRNLMENGIRDISGQHPGKTIVFARNHNHAVLISELFYEMYPQYGGNFCQVIDIYDSRAEQLIDDFKDPDNDLTVAISVDMLDTGIDVPEIVNLVFAKPVWSWVKFWQMIGRGTRLCKNLFGVGKDKERFRIFDHWSNFDRFDVEQPEMEKAPSKSLMQIVFETRIHLAETALQKAETNVFEIIIDLIRKDINSLPEESISVREKWRDKRVVSQENTLKSFAPETVLTLKTTIAPLMQWVNIRDHLDAYYFDMLITQIQIELLNDSGRIVDFKDKIQNQISQLLMHLTPVRQKADIIKEVSKSSFWDEISVEKLESLRQDLRGIMHYRQKFSGSESTPKTVDIKDGDVKISQQKVNISSIDKMIYTQLVEEALKNLFDTNLTLQKIRKGQSVREAELDSLVSLVLTQHPDVDLNVLREFFPDTADSLDYIIRTIVGMESDAVRERFSEFARTPGLTSKQTKFLNLLQNHITRYGAITVERLYESPFTTIDANGIDGVFDDEKQITELLTIINTFKPYAGAH